MTTLIAIPLTLWLAALVATPRRPLPGNEAAELVYARVLGRQQRLVLLAFFATAVAVFVLFASMTQHARADAVAARSAGVTCSESPTGQPTCYRTLPRGGWQQEQFQADGTWRAVGTARP